MKFVVLVLLFACGRTEAERSTSGAGSSGVDASTSSLHMGAAISVDASAPHPMATAGTCKHWESRMAPGNCAP